MDSKREQIIIFKLLPKKNCIPILSPKHRGWKRQDGSWVTRGTILATQTKPRFFPGSHVSIQKSCVGETLNFVLLLVLQVGWGVNGTLFALTPGKVYITCEKTDMDFNRPWIQRFFAGREEQTIYKKYFNVVPMKQHQRFKLIEEN